jgi:type IV secretory pathway VirD2 relaxase
LAPAVLKTGKKKELETEFQLFWNNINQKVMGYQPI